MFPAWLAAMLQVPVLSKVTVEPDTVQTDVVVEVMLTDNPELAVAATVKGAAPSTRSVSALNVIT